MPIGVRINNGIQFSSKPLLENSDVVSTKTMIGQHADFKVIVESFTKLYKSDNQERSIAFSEQIAASDNLIERLQCTEKQSMTSFIYAREADLMRAQSIFIDIGLHMLEFSDYVNQFLKEKYYGVLTAILFRSELDLGQMMFEKQGSMSQKMLVAKKKLAAEY